MALFGGYLLLLNASLCLYSLKIPLGRGSLCRFGSTRSDAAELGEGFVVSSIAQGTCYGNNNLTRLPLLEPKHGLPFYIALELFAQEDFDGFTNRNSPSLFATSSLYELRFFLTGSGTIHNFQGKEVDIRAGDTVLTPAGATWCFAAQHSLGEPLACLVAYIPQNLFKHVAENSDINDESLVEELKETLEELFCRNNFSVMSPTTGVPGPMYSVLKSAKGMVDVSSSSISAPQKRLSSPQRLSWWKRFIDYSQSWLFSIRLHSDTSALPTVRRTLQDLIAFQLPNQTNRLALVFDPMEKQDAVPFVFGVEIFEPLHKTVPHVHPNAFEVFFILSGQGEAFCDSRRMPVQIGDIIAFRPGATHGIDNTSTEEKIYCLELMLPNENFAEFVRSGLPIGNLNDDDLCIIARIGCS